MKNILNGQCLADFESWYIPYIQEQREDYKYISQASLLRKFNRKILSEKFGIYQDFFQQNDILFNFKYRAQFEEGYIFGLDVIGFYDFEDRETIYDTIGNLRIEAIGYANKIYNKNTKS